MDVAFTQWAFDANGSTGVLRILGEDATGNLEEVSVKFDGLDRIDTWEGQWDAASQQITLRRSLPGGAVQEHVGYAGDNDPNNLILAGYFTESDVPSNSPRQRFGWFAANQTDIIT
jgi:hypothetical protein